MLKKYYVHKLYFSMYVVQLKLIVSDLFSRTLLTLLFVRINYMFLKYDEPQRALVAKVFILFIVYEPTAHHQVLNKYIRIVSSLLKLINILHCIREHAECLVFK